VPHLIERLNHVIICLPEIMDQTETVLTDSRKPASRLSLNLTVENLLLRSPSSTESSPQFTSAIWRFLFPEGHSVAVYAFFLVLQSLLIILQ
jgi:hypothetical protein